MKPARPSIALAAALVAASHPALAVPASSPSADVTVTIDRMVFPDGLYRTRFVVAGACVPSTDAVHVLESTCGDLATTDSSSGTVRMAKLGFDAYRRVEAGRADAPLLETGQALAPEQLDRVLVRVKEAGDLHVEISGAPFAGLDPRPIAGTASSGGQIEGRSVVWTVPAAAPGTYEFSVRFAPNAPPGFQGTFVPAVTISRTAPSDRLLDHVGAPPPPLSPVAVQRTSRLVLQQHVAPAYGPPIRGGSPFVDVEDPFPAAFETSTSLDGSGAYYATASGPVEAVSVGLLDDIAPGALGTINTLGIAASRPWIPGADKVRANPTFERDQAGDIVGFRQELETPTATDIDIPIPPGPLGGTFWDGDAAIVGAVAGIGEVSADRQGQPLNDVGVVATDWGGSTAVAWSGLWANNAPAGEPNALNYAKYKRDVENAALTAAGYPGGYGPFAVVGMTEAAIPVTARGGDIDNRGGTTMVGDPVTVRVPQGHTFAGAFTFTVWMEQTNYRFELDAGPDGLTITPQVGPGGVWLESTRVGYHRDWANLHLVSMFSTEMGRQYEAQRVTTSTVVVPRGVVGALDVIDADGIVTDHRELSVGVWTATLTPHRLVLIRVGPSR